MTRHFPLENFKGRPQPPKTGPFVHWHCDQRVELRGLPGGFVTEDQLSAVFDAYAFVDEIPIALGRFGTRREAAVAIASVHGGGHD